MRNNNLTNKSHSHAPLLSTKDKEGVVSVVPDADCGGRHNLSDDCNEASATQPPHPSANIPAFCAPKGADLPAAWLSTCTSALPWLHRVHTNYIYSQGVRFVKFTPNAPNGGRKPSQDMQETRQWPKWRRSPPPTPVDGIDGIPLADIRPRG